MNQKLLGKVLATSLAVILTFTNFIMLGIYANKSYAISDELEKQGTVSNNENVKFDAYFTTSESKKVHTLKQDIDEKGKLYLSVNVQKGYLKNAKIEMLGADKKPVNFQILNEENNLSAVEKIDIDKNIIMLKQIGSGTGIVLDIPVASKKTEIFDLSDFNKINDITLTGSYVDNTGKTIQIEKTIKIRNEWNKETKAILEQETKTYIPYEIEGSLGTILQTIIKTGIENNSLPMKQTKITIEVPQIEGQKPEEVIVNNLSGWEYNKETGILTIVTENKANEENKVIWNKTDKNEYTVTYKYKEKFEKIETKQKAKVIIEAYNDTITKLEKEDSLEIKENENKGNFVTVEFFANDELNKGYLYTKKELEVAYNEKVILEVAYANLVDKIIVENSIDNFVNEQEELTKTAIDDKNYTYYKNTSISKANFEEILGQDGYIKIIGSDGEQLAIFTKDTEANEEGNYIYNYESKINEIKIETSKPVKNGKIEINHVKALNGKTDYNKNQVEDFKKLQLKTTANVEYANTKIETVEKIKDITLIAPSTKIELATNKSNLSTIVKNENVEFRVVLKTNDISCDLYKNPRIEIILPNYIQELEMKDVDLLFDDELKIKGRNSYVNENGNIVIQIELEGEQTKYSQNEVSKGANIVINTDITLKKLTPTKNDIVKVYVTNENATSYNETQSTKQKMRAQTDEKAYAENTLRAVAPTGMVTTTTISGFNKKGETITGVNGETITGKLDAKSEAKIATVEMSVINNYNNVAKNIKILGRMPVEGNTDVETKELLGSNMSTRVTKLVNLKDQNITHKIYYTTNPSATQELTKEENGWKEIDEIEDITQIQSYLIVLEDYEMNTGDIVEFNYDTRISENVEYGKSVYSNYGVYFDNVKENEVIYDKQISPKVCLTTGEGPNLEVSVSSNFDGDIEEGKLITYTVVVKNVGKTFANNVTLTSNIPEGTIYTVFEGMEGSEDPVTKVQYEGIHEYQTKFEQINPEEIVMATYQVEAKMLENKQEKEIEVVANAKVENYDDTFKSKPKTNKIVEGYLNVEMELSPSYTNKKEGQSFAYITKIENVNNTPKENVVVTSKIPNGVTFVGANEDGVYNKETNTVTWNIGKLDGLASKTVILTVQINKFDINQSIQEIANTMTVKTKDKEIVTNEAKVIVTKPVLTITQSTRTKEEVSVGDVIEYNVTVKNVGEVAANGVEIRDYLPEGLIYKGSTYIIDGEEHTSWIGNTDATIILSTIKPGATIDITIKAQVENTEENNKEREIVNIVTLYAEDMTNIGSNEVKHRIVEKVETDDPSVEEPVEGTYKITGLAWLDKNANGKRDDDEELLSGIEVILVNSETGEIVKDIVTGAHKIQTTNTKGTYTFANLESGKYLVVFKYDNQNYAITSYKQAGVIDNKNSDVIAMDVTINGEKLKAAVANSIVITSEDITNIDMGLILKPKFDLKLDKSVSKITVNNSNKTKEYTYNDAKFAKIDLKDKTVEGTTVIVEYKIKVTNEGEIAGYVKKVVDYMPTDMKFSSELNKDWYEGESGNLYNSSLANTLLQPGETKEITLVLTKVMTNENTGTINNVAEIYEAINNLGVEDIDSTPANKVQTEDDISSADVVIGVKTGEIYVYIVITLTSVALLGVGIYFINKKVLKNI